MFIRQIITQLKEKDMYFKLSKYAIHRTHEWNNTHTVHTKPKGTPYRIVGCWFQRTLKQLEREQTDTQTHTHTQDNYSNPRVYSNPRGCVPRVNEHKHPHPHTLHCVQTRNTMSRTVLTAPSCSPRRWLPSSLS